MTELVILNGIIQSQSEYIYSGGTVIFHQAPAAGSTINIMLDDERLSYESNGTTYAFPAPVSQKIQFKQFMAEVYKHKDNPTVKDQLEKLKIVMELLR